MIKYYPSHKNILNKYNSICGHQTGIMDSLIIMQANSVIAENINTCTAMLPDYHKILLGDNAEVNYHLSGYGIYIFIVYVAKIIIFLISRQQKIFFFICLSN